MKRTAVGLGEIKVSADPCERLTIFGLGSCIALYLYDPAQGVTGLAHVVLPDSHGWPTDEVGRYADIAVPALLRMVEARGALRPSLRAAIAGGAAVLGIPNRIGQMNTEAVRAELGRRGIPLVFEDVGGRSGRSVEFDAKENRLEVRILKSPARSV